MLYSLSLTDVGFIETMIPVYEGKCWDTTTSTIHSVLQGIILGHSLCDVQRSIAHGPNHCDELRQHGWESPSAPKDL